MRLYIPCKLSHNGATRPDLPSRWPAVHQADLPYVNGTLQHLGVISVMYENTGVCDPTLDLFWQVAASPPPPLPCGPAALLPCFCILATT